MKFAKLLLNLIFLLHSTTWIVFNFFKFKRKLNSDLNIKKLMPLNFIKWRFGNFYFTGYINQQKVFVKTDFLLGLIKNEYEVHKVFEASETHVIYKPPLIAYAKNYVVYKYIPGLALDDFFKKNKPVSDTLLLNVISQLNQILDFLISHHIVHRDFTTRNIMILTSGQIVPIDFYFSKSSELKYSLVDVELNLLTKNIIYRKLGIQKSDLLWDDAYSIHRSLKLVIEPNQFELLKTIEQKIGKMEFSYKEIKDLST
jgi:serine/threonine protein kinase